MPPFNLETCARANILALQPYRCARDDYKDDGQNILLDANENAYGPAIDLAGTAAAPPPTDPSPADGIDMDLAALHRYPDPHQDDLKRLLCALRNGDGTAPPSSSSSSSSPPPPPLTPANLFLGVGSDEAIDALVRCFCVPASRDRILTCPPTYGMYAICAQVNDVPLVTVPLLPGPSFGLDVPAIVAALSASAAPSSPPSPDDNDDDDNNNAPDNNNNNNNNDSSSSSSSSSSSNTCIKLLYLCSPGNPTASLLSPADLQPLLDHPTWNGIIVLDEAYIDFSPPNTSLAPLTTAHPNLVVLQTLSKAFGLAGIRLGAAFCAPPVARLLNSIKAPYNIAGPTSAVARHALSAPGLARMRRNVSRIAAQRERLLGEMPLVEGVGRLRGGTAANFLLYEVLDAAGKPDNRVAKAVYERLAEQTGVVVRFRGNEHGCEGCLRVTVGTEDEVTRFLGSLRAVLAAVRGGAS